MSGSHLSKDFFELVKSIGESKSKQEEDRIIVHEVSNLKKRMNEDIKESNSVIKKRMKEFLIRIMYVEMLGHDASFGYIKAVELTASNNLIAKRVGYLTCSLVLSVTHEFRFMIINQLQRDLQSSNHLEVCSALIAVCKLVTIEMIPAVQPMIMDLLKHDNELVRKKAVMAIHKFHQLNPDSIIESCDNLRRTLCDKDPSVMGAALCILHDLGYKNPNEYKDLVPSYVSILKQITEHRLPREFDYHRIPAPWIQIRLLKILATLGQADQQASEGMYEVLHDVMRRADTGINVGYAIIYECVRTVTTIYPNSTLLDAAAASISRFISSDNHNLKYLGVTGLAAIVKDHPRYAAAHQMAVIDCLEDPDETLKRKTLDLLYRMTNPVNVEFITEKLTQFLRESNDVFLRTELVSRITQCAERYAPSNGWYIQTMTNVFELGGELVREEVAHNLLYLIAEGSEDDEEQEIELRRDAVDTYLDLLEKPVLPDILVRVISWVLGEYGYLSEIMDLQEICDCLCEIVDRPFQEEDITRGYIIMAIMKMTAQLGGNATPVAMAMVEKYSKSRSTDIQQRCFEFISLNKNKQMMQQVLPEDASSEDIEIDPNMNFLDSFVQAAIASGSSPYSPPPDDSDDDDDRHRNRSADKNTLNFQAYEKPELPYASTKYAQRNPNDPTKGGIQNAMPSINIQNSRWCPSDPEYSMTKRGIKNVWGPTGLNTGDNQPSLQVVQAPENPPSVAAYGHQSQFNQQSYTSSNAYNQQVPNECGYRTGYNDHGKLSATYEGEMEEEQQPDERQILASALFGGLPGATQIPRGSTVSKRTSQRSSALGTMNRRQSRPTAALKRRNTPDEAVESPSRLSVPPTVAPPLVQVDLLDISFDSAPSAASNPISTTNATNDPFAVSSSISSTPAPVPINPVKDPFNLEQLHTAIPNVQAGFNFNGIALEPCKITTKDFGSTWGTCKCEKKVKISPTNIGNLNEYMNCMVQNKIYLVEAIAQTNEAIASAKLVNSNMMCLIHTKLRSAGYLDLTVRTSDQLFTDAILSYLIEILK